MAAGSITSSITEWITGAIGDYGLYAVFALMVVDAVLPAASELVMLYAGAVAAGAFAGQDVVLLGERIDSAFWGFVAMALAGTAGYTAGAVLGWGIGIYGGRPYLERHGRWLHVSPERLERAERWFERFGAAAAFLGRVTPVVRSFISIPAGVFRMALAPYTALTFAGSTVWCLAFAGAGWALGESWERFHEQFRYVDYAVGVAIVALVVAAVLRRRSSRVGAREQVQAGEAGESLVQTAEASAELMPDRRGGASGETRRGACPAGAQDRSDRGEA